jgi:hypothetical protein
VYESRGWKKVLCVLGFYYWLNFLDKNITVLLLKLGHRSFRRFLEITTIYLSRKKRSEKEEYCKILIKKGKS